MSRAPSLGTPLAATSRPACSVVHAAGIFGSAGRFVSPAPQALLAALVPPVALPPVAVGLRPPVALPPTAAPPVAAPPVAVAFVPPVAAPPVADPPTLSPPLARPPEARPPTLTPPPISAPDAVVPPVTVGLAPALVAPIALEPPVDKVPAELVSPPTAAAPPDAEEELSLPLHPRSKMARLEAITMRLALVLCRWFEWSMGVTGWKKSDVLVHTFSQYLCRWIVPLRLTEIQRLRRIHRARRTGFDTVNSWALSDETQPSTLQARSPSPKVQRSSVCAASSRRERAVGTGSGNPMNTCLQAIMKKARARGYTIVEPWRRNPLSRQTGGGLARTPCPHLASNRANSAAREFSSDNTSRRSEIIRRVAQKDLRPLAKCLDYDCTRVRDVRLQFQGGYR